MPADLSEDAPQWCVLHVKPRCEKKMAGYLASTQFDQYLPLRAETKIYQRRKVAVEKPVFPGYVFACVSRDRRVLVLKSRLVVHVLEVRDQAQFMNEIRQIRLALDVNPALGACPALTQGECVRIVSGPFQGLEGRVKVLKSRTQVVLNVEGIGQGVAVEVSMDMVERQ